MASKAISSFRRMGMTYLEHVNVCTASLRQVMKPVAGGKKAQSTSYLLREFKYVDGVEQKPEFFSNDAEMLAKKQSGES